MTNRRTRQFERDVREYQRTHPGTTLPEAREAVAARAAARQPGGLPTRIPHAPLPRPGETLAGYTERVAAAAGVHRHRAMELLGLAPGSSASRRLAELASGRLPDDAVRGLVSATGMTPAQARALTARPATIGTAAAAAYEALRHTCEEAGSSNVIRPGRGGKSRMSFTVALAMALPYVRAHLIDTIPAPSLDGWAESAAHPVFVDLPWPTEGTTPADPDLVAEVLKELGITPTPQAE
ncbi:TniQ family protein [Streptomyces olivaceoviridis]|uniref:TniQ family protein n=1 Tax=Streptomyces olivaceoviridis TaxID=1921 RepID=UPI00332BA9F2